MGNLKAAFENTSRLQRGGTCTFVALIDAMDDDDRVFLTDLMRGPWESSRIARALQEAGHDVGTSTVSRHRRGLCRCGRNG